MRVMSPSVSLTLAAVSACVFGSSLGAQVSGAKKVGATELRTAPACSLLTSAEVDKYIARGRRLVDEPGAMSLHGGAGSSCTYGMGMGQIILYSGEKSEEGLSSFLRAFNRDKETKHPVSGVGDRAYLIFPAPRNQYEHRVAFLFATAGRHTVGISLAADAGQSVESLQPDVVALAKVVISKLR